MGPSDTGRLCLRALFPKQKGFVKPSAFFLSALLVAGVLVPTVSAEIFTNDLDPRAPSFSTKTELVDTIVVSINAVRGKSSDHRRIARKSKKAIPCAAKSKGKSKGRVSQLLKNSVTSVCMEYGDGILSLRSRRAGSDSLIEWIPVRLSDAPRSSLDKVRLLSLDGSTLIEIELRERSGEKEGVLDDRSLVLIDPVRERYLLNVMRSHAVEGGRDEGNYTESCEGVAQIRGNRIILGGYACQEESEAESPSGEIRTYTRSTGPDPEFAYRYLNGFLYQAP